MMKLGIFRWERAMGREHLRAWKLALSAAILGSAVGIPVLAQESSQATESVADAARAARGQKAGAAKQAKVITTDDLVLPSPLPVESGSAAAPSSKAPTGRTASKTPAGQAAANRPLESATTQSEEPAEKKDCDNPDDQRLKAELQAAQDERDQLRRELNADPPVISGGNVDMTNFKSGGSGVAFGSPPLSQTQPQSPARIQEVELNERIASLERAMKIACDSPEDAGIQRKIDDAERQLKMLQQEFALDRNAYYSKPNYVEDSAGKAKLDGEQQQMDELQSEIDQLKQELTEQQPQ
jgi:hypothetical protein